MSFAAKFRKSVSVASTENAVWILDSLFLFSCFSLSRVFSICVSFLLLTVFHVCFHDSTLIYGNKNIQRNLFSNVLFPFLLSSVVPYLSLSAWGHERRWLHTLRSLELRLWLDVTSAYQASDFHFLHCLMQLRERYAFWVNFPGSSLLFTPYHVW